MATKEPDAVALQQTQKLPPEYIEKLLKDIIANLYSADEDGNVTGLLATSPLEGTQLYAEMMDEEGNVLYDEEGNVMYDEERPLYEMEDGSYTDNPDLAAVDQHGNPIMAVEGGVPEADIMKFTPAQEEAIRMMVEDGIGAYEPMMQKAAESMDRGIGAYESGLKDLAATAQAYDPESYKDFYDPFVEQVIDATERDIMRQGEMQQNQQAAQAVGSGAYGGSREAVQRAEIGRNVMDTMARTGAQLRSAAYTGAQTQAQNAFENQMKRGQSASQLFGALGQGIGALGTSQGALGEAGQAAMFRDVNALYNVGALEQGQMQKEYDVQRAAALEAAYEPYQRFGYLSNFAQGLPMTTQTLGMTSAPAANPLADIYGSANNLAAANLGGLLSPSGSK